MTTTGPHDPARRPGWRRAQIAVFLLAALLTAVTGASAPPASADVAPPPWPTGDVFDPSLWSGVVRQQIQLDNVAPQIGQIDHDTWDVVTIYDFSANPRIGGASTGHEQRIQVDDDPCTTDATWDLSLIHI